MEFIPIIGYIAATLTTWGYIPQIRKAIKTKSTADVSLLMFVMIGAGVFLWLVYGLFTKSGPLVVANALTLVFILIVLFLKRKYG
ncbi:MAG: SemiSWEET transporter [Nanoarchaeota archaeon]